MPEYKFDVTMTCSGCSNAVGRALTKAGMLNHEISLETQKVIVRSDETEDKVLEVIKKTGKAVQISK